MVMVMVMVAKRIAIGAMVRLTATAGISGGY